MGTMRVMVMPRHNRTLMGKTVTVTGETMRVMAMPRHNRIATMPYRLALINFRRQYIHTADQLPFSV